MKDDYGRVQTYAQALREMNVTDMAKYICEIIKDISDLEIDNDLLKEKLESPTEIELLEEMDMD